jgi:hypothetical protein
MSPNLRIGGLAYLDAIKPDSLYSQGERCLARPNQIITPNELFSLLTAAGIDVTQHQARSACGLLLATLDNKAASKPKLS